MSNIGQSLIQIRGTPVQQLLAKDAVVSTPIPRFAHVYIENNCNLKCEHCYESETSHPTDRQQILSLQDYARIFEELASMGVMVLTLSGGEVFLRRDAMEIIALAREKRFAVRVFTSGTLLNVERVKRLKELGVSEVHISLYSHLADVHDGFTQTPKSHERSVRAMRMLVESGITTVMKTLVMRLNVDHLEEILALAKQLGVRSEFDANLHPKMDANPAPLEQMVPPDELSIKFFSNPRLWTSSGLATPEEICTGEDPRSKDAGVCSAARRIISIGADGGVYPCALFPVAGGMAKAHSVVDIWRRSVLFDNIRKTNRRDLITCRTCDVQNSCDPCMAYALIENGDHRACNAGSRNTALGTHMTAQVRTRTNEKMSRARPLPILTSLGAPKSAPPMVGL